MVAGFSITIPCTDCDNPVSIPYQPSKKLPWIGKCQRCGKQFGIDSPTIARQIKLFTDLCHQIKDSEEILANASIGVTVGSTEVKIPFRLLLTRLRTSLELTIDGRKVFVSSRVEPSKMKEPLSSTLSTDT